MNMFGDDASGHVKPEIMEKWKLQDCPSIDEKVKKIL